MVGASGRTRFARLPATLASSAIELAGGGRMGTEQPDLADATSARAVVLVEGVSDEIALETLAERRRRDLPAERIAILPMGGSKNIEAFLARYGRQGLDLRLAGL